MCTDDECNGTGTCLHTANTDSCNDGLFCNGADVCAGGVCTHDGNPCATDPACDEACNETTDQCTDPTGEHATEGNVQAHAFTGSSPAFLIATARLLRLTPDSPSKRVRLVRFTDPVLAPRTLDQSWSLQKIEAHATDNGPLSVAEYQVGDLDTGEQHTVHIAGDVVLAAPGLELEDLETPPSVFP